MTSLPAPWRLVRRLALLLGLLPGLPPLLLAHPVPNSVVLLDIRPQRVDAELQLPLPELQPAFDHGDLVGHPAEVVARYEADLRRYLLRHIHPVSPDGRPWQVQVGAMHVGGAEQPDTGPYQQLVVRARLLPPPGASPRAFTLRYDVIVHQVVTHVALVAVRQDWETGRFAEQPPTEVGVIRLSPRDNVIAPLLVQQAGGSWWRGFTGMVGLGMQHIAAGTDHLLFLLALLLPAPLLVVAGRRWGGFGGVRYSLRRLLLIVTAFTLGHSLTLLLGALGWVRLPGQPVETLIAVSILVSAAHAWRPVFAGREAWVAGGFGLVHGLAFASTLADLQLDATRTGLSILGFNLGIELMQLLVIGLTIPWLLLARTPYYRWVRVGGAAGAAVAALAWLAERLSGQPNAVVAAVTRLADYAPGLLAALALAAGLAWWQGRAVGPAGP